MPRALFEQNAARSVVAILCVLRAAVAYVDAADMDLVRSVNQDRESGNFMKRGGCDFETRDVLGEDPVVARELRKRDVPWRETFRRMMNSGAITVD